MGEELKGKIKELDDKNKYLLLKNSAASSENKHLMLKLGQAVEGIKKVVDNLDSPVIGTRRPWRDWSKQCYDIAVNRDKVDHETTQAEQVGAIDDELEELSEAANQGLRAGTDSSKTFLENYEGTVEQELCDILIACGTLAHMARVDLDEVMPLVLKYNRERKY